MLAVLGFLAIISVQTASGVFTPANKDALIAAVLCYNCLHNKGAFGHNCDQCAYQTYGDISEWDVSKVTDMSGLFTSACYDEDFNPDLSKWDVSKVTNMKSMFEGLSSLQHFNSDLSNWDVSKVTDMSDMFNGAHSFNGDLSKWDVSKVTDMGAMFMFANSFNGDLSKWNVSKLTKARFMFNNAISFNGDLSKWDVSSLTDIDGMFSFAHSFNGDLSKWDVSKVTSMEWTLGSAHNFNGDLSKWDVSKVVRMGEMFIHAYNFNCDLSKWDVSKVHDMDHMFDHAYSFSGDLSKWDVSKVTEWGLFNGMFDDSSCLLCDHVPPSLEAYCRASCLNHGMPPPTSAPPMPAGCIVKGPSYSIASPILHDAYKGVKDAAACASVCKENSKCTAFHYYGVGDVAHGHCYLHSAGTIEGPMHDGRDRYAGTCHTSALVMV